MIQSILVICVGNICRSPAAEKLFQHKLSGKLTASSAGLGAVVGHPMEDHMQKCLIESGITDLTHAARQFNAHMAQQVDLILAMEQAHIERITQLAPHAHGKTMLLGKWANDAEVADPYRHSEDFFRLTYGKIDQYVTEWADKLA